MDYDIIPPPPPVDKRNPAGGLLNRYDTTNLQMKVLCVGMYGTGKSTFLNRWQTNLKTKTRTTINIDFYEKHVEGYFPIMLQEKPDPKLLEPLEPTAPNYTNGNNIWATVDFPSSAPASSSKGIPLGGPSAATQQYLVTQSHFNNHANSSNTSAEGGSDNERGPSSVGGLLNRNNSNLGGRSYGSTGLTGSSTNTNGSGSGDAPGNSGGGGGASNTNALMTAANEAGVCIGAKSYRNSRFSDSTPNVHKALVKASEVAKKARANFIATNGTAVLEVLQRSTQKRPIAESEGMQILSIYLLTREMGNLSGAGRTSLELYGLCGPLADVRKTVRDPRQVAACAMNTSFGYCYYEKKSLHVQCWDIQGQEHSRNMTRTYYTDAVAALVFVDITRPESLLDAILWREDISKKVFVKTATDASMEGNGVGSPSPSNNAGNGGNAPTLSRHGRGPRSVAPRAGGGVPSSTPTDTGAPSAGGPTPNAGSGASYNVEEECQIPCWLVVNKCDLLDSKTYQFPSKEAWSAQVPFTEYQDLDDFCARVGFVGWSLASGAQNINVNGIMDRVIQQCCNQFPREIYRFSTRGKQNFLQAPKPRPKQQKKCCATK